MTPLTRPELEILLDAPGRRDFVVSAFVDLRVKDGFRSFAATHRRNQARAAHEALAGADARKALDEDLEAIAAAVSAADPAARGLAVFSGKSRGLFHAVSLDFPVEDRLVIDEDPFVLPLLERWYGDPSYLVAVVDANHLHLFGAHSGVARPVESLDRDIPEMQRDKSRFQYKKRFSKAFDERLVALDESPFLKEVAARVADHFGQGEFTGLILLGPTETTAAVRRLLPERVAREVVDEHQQPMTDRPEDVADDVERAMTRWRERREGELLAELRGRWKESHLVADGAQDVLDALQQGRAAQVVVGPSRDAVGSQCRDCGYRFGAPAPRCAHCGGETRTVNAVQEILRMALRHRVPVHLFARDRPDDPLQPAGGVAALLRAEANWAPDKATAEASRGH
jgi:protein required for attachment to host cells